jgi:hypothetical protein
MRLDETTRKEDAKEGHYVRANGDAAFFIIIIYAGRILEYAQAEWMQWQCIARRKKE